MLTFALFKSIEAKDEEVEEVTKKQQEKKRLLHKITIPYRSRRHPPPHIPSDVIQNKFNNVLTKKNRYNAAVYAAIGVLTHSIRRISTLKTSNQPNVYVSKSLDITLRTIRRLNQISISFRNNFIRIKMGNDVYTTDDGILYTIGPSPQSTELSLIDFIVKS